MPNNAWLCRGEQRQVHGARQRKTHTRNLQDEARLVRSEFQGRLPSPQRFLFRSKPHGHVQRQARRVVECFGGCDRQAAAALVARILVKHLEGNWHVADERRGRGRAQAQRNDFAVYCAQLCLDHAFAAIKVGPQVGETVPSRAEKAPVGLMQPSGLLREIQTWAGGLGYYRQAVRRHHRRGALKTEGDLDGSLSQRGRRMRLVRPLPPRETRDPRLFGRPSAGVERRDAGHGDAARPSVQQHLRTPRGRPWGLRSGREKCAIREHVAEGAHDRLDLHHQRPADQALSRGHSG
mmetsp:Transcript_79362/g.242838  ORF Transcript_79362/g.242838 Transcript_79362/m.242838 type:complete len:293 (-) Transcript_79362:184-1062(-)